MSKNSPKKLTKAKRKIDTQPTAANTSQPAKKSKGIGKATEGIDLPQWSLRSKSIQMKVLDKKGENSVQRAFRRVLNKELREERQSQTNNNATVIQTESENPCKGFAPQQLAEGSQVNESELDNSHNINLGSAGPSTDKNPGNIPALGNNDVISGNQERTPARNEHDGIDLDVHASEDEFGPEKESDEQTLQRPDSNNSDESPVESSSESETDSTSSSSSSSDDEEKIEN